MKNKITALLFIALIFVCGAGTVYKSYGEILDMVKNGDLDSKTPKKIESVIQDQMYKKIWWIDIHGLTQRILDRSVVDEPGSDVYRLSDGSLSGGCGWKKDEKLEKFAANINKVRERISPEVDLLYVQLPFKVDTNDQMPPGVKSYANENCDRLLAAIEGYGIETLDIRKCIHEEGLNWPDLFYKTDHHWRPQTAMWAAGKISEYLAEEHGYAYDASLYDPDNMDTEVFPDLFLGSLGRRTGSLYAGTDDFELVTPSYETHFDFRSYPGDIEIHREGSFREALIDDGNLKKDYYNINNYAAYTGDSTKTSTTINFDPINHKKILLVRDSYSCALQPFLSLSQEQVTTIDLRYYRDESVIDHINNNDYDLVIIAYTPSAFDKERFTFHKIPE